MLHVKSEQCPGRTARGGDGGQVADATAAAAVGQLPAWAVPVEARLRCHRAPKPAFPGLAARDLLLEREGGRGPSLLCQPPGQAEGKERPLVRCALLARRRRLSRLCLILLRPHIASILSHSSAGPERAGNPHRARHGHVCARGVGLHRSLSTGEKPRGLWQLARRRCAPSQGLDTRRPPVCFTRAARASLLSQVGRKASRCGERTCSWRCSWRWPPAPPRKVGGSAGSWCRSCPCGGASPSPPTQILACN